MKKIIIICALSTMIFSCRNNENENLKKRIAELEILNNKLNESLHALELSKLRSSELLLFPQKYTFEVGRNYEVYGRMFEKAKIHRYNVYQTDSLHTTESRRLLIKDCSETQFKVNFKPKSKNDNVMFLLAEFKLDSLKIEFPGIINFDVR
jgi:hypothetical protein